MEIVSTTVRAVTPVAGAHVDRDFVVEIHSSDVKTARLEAAFRLEREHPEATFEVIDHEVVERPRHTRTSYETGTYRVTVRGRGLLEEVQ